MDVRLHPFVPKACFHGIRSKLFCSPLGLEAQIEKLGEQQMAETFRAHVEKPRDRLEEGAVRVIATVPDLLIAKLQVYASSLADFQHRLQLECQGAAVGLLRGLPPWRRIGFGDSRGARRSGSCRQARAACL